MVKILHKDLEMIIDEKVGSAYSCLYKIAIASKFNAHCFDEDCPKTRKALLLANDIDDISFHHLIITKQHIEFEIRVSPDRPVSASVFQIRKAMTALLVDNKIFKEMPIFSTSFYCETLGVKANTQEFIDALKPSYKSKKGALL